MQQPTVETLILGPKSLRLLVLAFSSFEHDFSSMALTLGLTFPKQRLNRCLWKVFRDFCFAPKSCILISIVRL